MADGVDSLDLEALGKLAQVVACEVSNCHPS